MTVICALRDGDKVWIGSDSRMTSGGGHIYAGAHQKWIHWGDWWIGISGTPRLANVIALAPVPPADASVLEIVNTLRRLTKEDDWSAGSPGNGNGGPQDNGHNAIIVTPDRRVFDLGCRWSVTEAFDNFTACGSGCEYAYGAAYASREKPLGQIVMTALQAACVMSATCGEPLFVQQV